MPRGTLNELPGDHHADIAAYDTYLDGFPHDTFERLRREDRWRGPFEVEEPDRLDSDFIRGIKPHPVRVR